MTREQALRIGKLWEKNGMSRIYFNAAEVAEACGLKVAFYNTGNVSSATLDGESISNSRGSRYIVSICDGKYWFDCSTNKVTIRCSGYLPFSDVNDLVKKLVALSESRANITA